MKSPQVTAKWNHLVTCNKAAITVTSPYSFRNVDHLRINMWIHCDVIWWFITMKWSWWLRNVFSKYHVIITKWLHCPLLPFVHHQMSNSHGDFSVKSPNGDHLRINTWDEWNMSHFDSPYWMWHLQSFVTFTRRYIDRLCCKDSKHLFSNSDVHVFFRVLTI